MAGKTPIQKYIYDKTWLQTILTNTCPTCNKTLTRKGIKRQCPQNHITIYGNPILVAYKKKEQINTLPNRIQYTHCPECGSTQFIEDQDRHETICKCGLVLAGPPQYGIKYPWHDNYVGVETQRYEPSPVYTDEETTWTEDPIKI